MESISRSPFARLTAGVTAMATLIVGLAASTATNPASADETKPSYTTARVTKIADGTGHGTNAQTFVNSKNGFTPGDDSPTDGIVASGDTVEYKLRLDFTAAGKRDVTVSFDTTDAPYLEPAAGGSFCAAGKQVTAKGDTGSCTYTVPAGVVESMTQTFFMKAKDTGGTAKSGQVLKVSVKRDGGPADTYRTDEITVVSAPAADVEVDNGGMKDNHWPAERTTLWEDGKNPSGYFDLKIVPLHYKDYSSNGASTSGPWSGTLDVSAFPTGTTFELGGKTVKPSNGRIRVENVEGNQRLDWNIPAIKGCDADAKDDAACIHDGEVKSYDVKLDVDETSFMAEGQDALRNMGDGHEPGTGDNRDKSTADGGTGSIEGYPYPNNNTSRALVKRWTPPVPHGTIYVFQKTLERPYSYGHTIFDDESLTFDKAGGRQTVTHHTWTKDDSDKVAHGSVVRTTLTGTQTRDSSCATANDNVDQNGQEQHRTGCSVTFWDSWDNTQQQYDGNLAATSDTEGLETIPADWIRTYWTETAAPNSHMTADADGKAVWHEGEPAGADRSKARTIKIVITPQNTDILPKGSIEVGYDMLMTGQPKEGTGNISAHDYMRGEYAAWGDWTDSDYVTIVAPGKAANGVGYKAEITDQSGNRRDIDSRPGDTVTYTAEPTVSNVQSSHTPVTPTATVCVDANTTNPVNDNAAWNMTAEPAGKSGPCAGYKTQLTFTLNTTDGSTILSYDQTGNASLPRIVWHGTTSNLAAGTAKSTIILDTRFGQVGQIPASDAKATADAEYLVSTAGGSSGSIKADQAKVEIDDPISYTWNTYVKDTGMTGTMGTVIKLPRNDDQAMTGKNNTGLDGSWNEYDLGSSHYTGTYTMETEPVIGDDSTRTTLKYAVEDKTSLTPGDYEWKTWNQIEDKSQIRAILVTSAIQEAQDGSQTDGRKMMVAASTGTITIIPSGNRKDDQYNMWIGANHVQHADNTEEHIPFPAASGIVSSSITGTVWWDQDRNTLIGKDEQRIQGVQVSLYQADQDGNPTGKPVAQAKTDETGRYSFTGLHSGGYLTQVKRESGTTTGSGVQTLTDTYYGRTMSVENTRSWSNKLKEQARDTSDRIPLGIGVDKTRIDFGYATPDPKAIVDKTRTGLSCDDAACTVNWDVKVENKGNTRFDASSVLTDRMSSKIHDVTATAGTVSIEPGGAKQVATSGGHKFVLTNEGVLYAWGDNQYGQLGFAPDTDYGYTPSNTNRPTIVDGTWSKVAAGGKHSAAIDTDGHLWTAGWNGKGQLGTGDTDNRTTWTETASDRTFTDVACGNDFTLAIAADGTLWSTGWGTPDWTQAQPGTTFTQVSATANTWTALASDGTVRYNTANQANAYRIEGICTQVAAGLGLVLCLRADGNVQIGSSLVVGLKDVKSIAAGHHSYYAITNDGHLWTWGWNGDGQLANGRTGNGTYWTDDGTAEDIVSTPTDTGVTASAVAGGDRDALIVSDKVMIAGYDPYGDGKSGAMRDTGLKGTVTTVDPTAMPVTPTGESDDGTDTTRTYSLPYTVEPGGQVVFHMTGTVNREDKTQTIRNQAWFDSTDTPYKGTPNARANGKTIPDKPDDTKLDKSSNDITGNPSCMTGTDYQGADHEHTFTDLHEDSCDQVGGIIPAYTRKPVSGSISGLYWRDTNRDGIRQTDETERIGGQKVFLYDMQGHQVSTTTTAKDGTYRFTGLRLASYTVQFTRVDRADFTKTDQDDTDPARDMSSTDSDASTGEDDHGRATPTITLTETSPDKPHIDAGVVPATDWTRSMPMTGLGILPVILILGVACTGAGVGMYVRNSKSKKENTNDKA
ncbi:SdrD B-like domain-containing protein [Bifidobacterium catenulatum]|uniref:SdrD B-like domain-containing protein n=1 Tax=Bifidobacterium catenulatum TaxID=1686 RepID=UPI003F903EEC